MRKVDPVVHGRQRERIMKCALSLFSARGYDAASLDEVARQCRMQKASLYHYFASKEALLREMIGWHMKRVHTGVLALPMGRSVERNLLEVGMDFVRGFSRKENRDFLRLLMRDAGTHGYLRNIFNRMDRTAIEDAMKAMRVMFAGRGKKTSLREHARIMHQYMGSLFGYVVETRLLRSEPSIRFGDREYVGSLARIFAAGLKV
jgi:AcrR family transcriptional regulator